MSKIKILIVEDEAIISEHLSIILKKAEFEVLDALCSGEEAYEYVFQKKPDVIIMDIELKGRLNGIETVKKINKKNNIPVVYLTQLTDDTTFRKAKCTYPASFLQKPFNDLSLLRAIELAFYGSPPMETEMDKLVNPESPKNQLISDKFIFVRNVNNKFFKLNFDDIIIIEADGNYSKIITKNQILTSSHTLKLLYSKINHPDLLRVHRSYVVNINYIQSIESKKKIFLDITELNKTKQDPDPKNKLPNKIEIPVSAEYRSVLDNMNWI